MLTGLEPFTTLHCIMKGMFHHVFTDILTIVVLFGIPASYVAIYLDLSATSEYTSWYVWFTSYGTFWTYDDTFHWPSDSSRTIWTSPRMSTWTPIHGAACSTRATSMWDFCGFNPAWYSWQSNTGLDITKTKDKELHGIPIVAKIHPCRSLHNNHINKLYHSPTATQQFLHHNKFYPFSNLRLVLNNNIFLYLKHLVQLLFKHYLLNLCPFLTNNNLLPQSLQLQHHYLPHIQNFKHQRQNLQAWTSKPCEIDLMLLWRKSLRIWLNLWSYPWHHQHQVHHLSHQHLWQELPRKLLRQHWKHLQQVFRHHFNLVTSNGANLLKYPSRPSLLLLQIWSNKLNNLHLIDLNGTVKDLL